jgi:ribose transport system permease protein
MSHFRHGASRLLSVLTFAILLGLIYRNQPLSVSYLGLTLLLGSSVPIVFATLAQMMFVSIGDLDLSIGPMVSLSAAIGAVVLPASPWLAALLYLLLVGFYAACGALIHLRRLSSIIVTLGMSFIWLGCALLLVPSPGGQAPQYLVDLMTAQTPWIPLPVLVAALAALIGYVIFNVTVFGTVVRGLGGNPKVIERSGRSSLLIRMRVYALAGVFGIVSGLLLLGQTTSADANQATSYTLISIAGVILGGGQFVGGKVFAVGSVFGALTMTLATSFLNFYQVSSDWQVAMQGLILIVALSLRAVIDSSGKTGMNQAPGVWRSNLRNSYWLSAWLAAVLVLIATAFFNAGKGGPGLGPLLTTALSFSTFTVLVSLGQMLVITSGPGNIDLSIPSVIALSGALSMSVMDSANHLIALGLLVALGSGAAVGAFNFILIRLLRMPPIIATMSSSLIVLSCAIAYGRGMRTAPPPLLAQMMVARIGPGSGQRISAADGCGRGDRRHVRGRWPGFAWRCLGRRVVHVSAGGVVEQRGRKRGFAHGIDRRHYRDGGAAD